MGELLCVGLGTPSGNVILSGPPDAVNEVVRCGNAHDALIAQRDALVEACESLMEAVEASRATHTAIPVAFFHAIDRAKDTLALVRGEADNA
jgi:hypothetical protein